MGIKGPNRSLRSAAQGQGVGDEKLFAARRKTIRKEINQAVDNVLTRGAPSRDADTEFGCFRPQNGKGSLRVPRVATDGRPETVRYVTPFKMLSRPE